MTGVQTCALRSEEHTSELQSHDNLVCRLLLEQKTAEDRGQRLCVGGLERDTTARRTRRLRPQARGDPPAVRSWSGSVLRGTGFIFFFKHGAPPKPYAFPLPDLFRI